MRHCLIKSFSWFENIHICFYAPIQFWKFCKEMVQLPYGTHMGVGRKNHVLRNFLFCPWTRSKIVLQSLKLFWGVAFMFRKLFEPCTFWYTLDNLFFPKFLNRNSSSKEHFQSWCHTQYKVRSVPKGTRFIKLPEHESDTPKQL